MRLALEELIQTDWLLPCPHGEKKMETDRGRETETRRAKLCNTRLHSAEDSSGGGSFNSAELRSTNKNLFINRDVRKIFARRHERGSALSTPLPLD